MKQDQGPCPDSVLGVHAEQLDGKCSWCGRQVTYVQPKPEPRNQLSELDEAYTQHWDPNGLP